MQTAHMQLWFPQYPQLLFISGAAPPQVSVRPRPVRLMPCVRAARKVNRVLSLCHVSMRCSDFGLSAERV